jgi:hypothetical protein
MQKCDNKLLNKTLKSVYERQLSFFNTLTLHYVLCRELEKQVSIIFWVIA